MNLTLDTVKGVAKFVVARSVSGVIVTTLHHNCPVETKSQKAQLYIGAYVVGSMVADAATDHVNAKIDSVHKMYTEYKENKKKSAE